MTPRHSLHGRDTHPDPFEVQIGSLVIYYRALFLQHNDRTTAKLVGLSKDYLDYGRLLERSSGTPSPFDPDAKEEPTPAEVFFETDDYVGHTRHVPKPSIGMAIRHFRLTPRGQAQCSQLGPVPEIAQSLAVVFLIQHPGKAWEVLHAETKAERRRQGIATMFYDRIAAFLDTSLRPSGWLSEDAYRFWQRRDGTTVQWHRQLSDLPGLWFSPKQLLIQRAIIEVKLMAGVEVTTRH